MPPPHSGAVKSLFRLYRRQVDGYGFGEDGATRGDACAFLRLLGGSIGFILCLQLRQSRLYERSWAALSRAAGRTIAGARSAYILRRRRRIFHIAASVVNYDDVWRCVRRAGVILWPSGEAY